MGSLGRPMPGLWDGGFQDDYIDRTMRIGKAQLFQERHMEREIGDEAKQIQENYKKLSAEAKQIQENHKEVEVTGVDLKAFQYNDKAKYQPGASTAKSVASLITANVLVKPAQDEGFAAKYSDVFEKYRMPLVESDSMIKTWSSNPMQFWQNQLNFATWCATTGCGVSQEDHLAAANPLTRSLFSFHVYYQIRRILAEIKAPLPQDQAWGATNNPYDRRAYERICNEFGVSPNSDWRVKGPNWGLGNIYQYAAGVGYFQMYAGYGYNPKTMSFTLKERRTNDVVNISYIKQDTPEASWTSFVLNKSEGFTRPGVERINDSIRAYVWAILGAQAQTRSGIIGVGTAFDAQKQFVANVEDAISSPVDLPGSVARYQNVLQYASSEVNFVFGIGLYMAPSNMELQIGTIQGYNNEIVIAKPGQKLGVNTNINMPRPDRGVPDMEGPAARPAQPAGPLGIVTAEAGPAPPADPVGGESAPRSGLEDHEDEKTAIVVGGVALGLFSLWLLR